MPVAAARNGKSSERQECRISLFADATCGAPDVAEVARLSGGA